MRTAFCKIKERLEDPFFEVHYLGKEAIRGRTLPMDRYVASPDNFQFIAWTKEDDRETIHYSYTDTEIGRVLIANTAKGICFLGFSCGDDHAVLQDLQKRFPHQECEEQPNELQKTATDYCNGNQKQVILLHVKGTDFQVNIWKKLVRIPEGRLSTYGSLSGNPKASQAVGSAVGANPVSYIIPCHRIVKGDGDFRGYHWGPDLKKQLLAYELQV